MNEIEKMYENAGMYRCNMPDIDCNKNCEKCEDYNLFTAEKQIELIKWIAHHDGCFKVHLNSIEFGDSGFGSCSSFEESLAKAVSNFLDSATEKEKQQIKEILK